MELSILGLLAIAYVSKLASASVPMLVLVQNGVGAGILTPIISLLIILGAISTAVNMISGIVTRCVNAVERRMDSPEKKRRDTLEEMQFLQQSLHSWHLPSHSSV